MTKQEQVRFAVQVLGRRYATDFTVVAIDHDGSAILAMRGQSYTVSLEELYAIINRGLVYETLPVVTREPSS